MQVTLHVFVNSSDNTHKEFSVIRITKFDGKSMILNADWIQSVEETPDTVITLTTGSKILVKDSVAEVVSAFEDYKRRQHFSYQTASRKES